MQPDITPSDIIIIGAGAAGLMCAIEAGKRGRQVTVIDHVEKIGEKIRISGGGRCNFTNLHCAPDRFISNNPHFCKSALSRYSQHDFIELVNRYGIKWHEKTRGQLFCDQSAQDIIDLLLNECSLANVVIQPNTKIISVCENNDRFMIKTSTNDYDCVSLVIATGGPSIPKIGATGFGYTIAEQFGLNVIPPYPALVPLTFNNDLLEFARDLTGVAVDSAQVSALSGPPFDEAVLFTHRGLSGPAILQISSYWRQGQTITLNLAPHLNALAWLKSERITRATTHLHTVLSDILPKRLAQKICDLIGIQGRLADLNNQALEKIASYINDWAIIPSGDEGYRTAEVARGGVDTDELSSKTFESKLVPGLYFIGEVVDVTGHLGGFNFQWAWSSGWCAGQYV